MELLTFCVSEPISLSRNPGYDEAWVEQRIRENPRILTLGDLEIKTNQLSQRGAGRLDLIADDRSDQSFVIELMLGELDAHHLMRVMDYWLRFKRLKANADRNLVAVLAAEQVLQSRYFPLIQFLAEKLGLELPFIVLELSALKVGDAVTLSFLKVVDSSQQQADEEEIEPRSPVTRESWVEYSSEDGMYVVDELVRKLHNLDSRISARYNQQFVGLTYGNRANHFVLFYPQRKFVQVSIRTRDASKWVERFADSGLELRDTQDGRVRIALKKELLVKAEPLIAELIAESYRDFARVNA